MLLGIDHLVIAVADPDAAAAVMEADLGLVVTGGGRHEGGGTFNRLAFLGDTYVELIGVFDRALVLASATNAVGQAAVRLLDTGAEGLATYALATGDVAGDVARLHALGSPIGDPVPGSRRRPDGEVVGWTCAFPELGPGEPPFLIEHEPRGAEWGRDARTRRAAFRHPGGGTVRVTAITIPVPSVRAAATRYREVLDVTFDAGGGAGIDGQLIRLTRATGPGTADPAIPIVDLAAEPGTQPLDLVRFGIRWRRSAVGTPGATGP